MRVIGFFFLTLFTPHKINGHFFFLLTFLIAGMKLRLIKSNSCNSRLELAGTRFNDGPLHKFCSRNRSISTTEDTVRNIIQRIETNSMQEKRVPRIIESKCIEKAATEASKLKSSAYRKDHLDGMSKSMERLGPIEILSQVNVKNHINAIGMKASSCNSIAGKISKEILPRNKDVDLAIQMNLKVNKDKDKPKALKKDILPPNDKSNGDHRSGKTGPITATIRPTSLLTKAELEERLLKENHKAILEDLCKAVARSEEEKSKKTNLVKWDSLEKNYFANDVALKRKPKYDDIEFEEFEVIEPKK